MPNITSMYFTLVFQRGTNLSVRLLAMLNINAGVKDKSNRPFYSCVLSCLAFE